MNLTLREAPGGACSIQGTADLYGLGVRLGLYLQFVTALFASLGSRRYLDRYREATLIFVTSCFITLVRQSARHRLYAVEVETMMWLFVPQLAIVSMSSKWLQTLSWGSLLMHVLNYAMAAFYTWFYFRGLDVMLESPCESSYAFFFARVNLYHWFRTLMKVSFAACLVYLVLAPISRFLEWYRTEALWSFMIVWWKFMSNAWRLVSMSPTVSKSLNRVLYYRPAMALYHMKTLVTSLFLLLTPRLY